MGSVVKLFVGGVPPSLTRQELVSLFAPWGGTRVELKSRPGGGNMGYAFLLLDSVEQAEAIMAARIKARGRELNIQYSQKLKRQKELPPPARLYLRHIPPGVSDEELLALFAEFVPVQSAYAIRDAQSRHKGFGFLQLQCQAHAELLLEIESFALGESFVLVERFQKQPKSTFHNRTAYVHHQHSITTTQRKQSPLEIHLSPILTSANNKQSAKHVADPSQSEPVMSKVHRSGLSSAHKSQSDSPDSRDKPESSFSFSENEDSSGGLLPLLGIRGARTGPAWQTSRGEPGKPQLLLRPDFRQDHRHLTLGPLPPHDPGNLRFNILCPQLRIGDSHSPS